MATNKKYNKSVSILLFCGTVLTGLLFSSFSLSFDGTYKGVQITSRQFDARDTDGDGVPNFIDAFPDDSGESVDTDGDGIGNNADTDDDNDGVDDGSDDLPLNPNESVDTDSDGIGDNSDNCVNTSNPDQTDTDNNGVGDACESGGSSLVWGSGSWGGVQWGATP